MVRKPYICNFSAQSNNEQHNRTNTTIAALSAAVDASSASSNSYQRAISAPEYEGMNIEFRTLDTQAEFPNNQTQTIGDVELGLALDSEGQHSAHNQPTSRPGYLMYIFCSG